MTWLAIALTALWLWLAWHDLRVVRALAPLPQLPPDGGPPASVTVVLAVRNDAEHVVDALRGLLAQRHVALTVAVVDDRSDDGTGERLAALAAGEPRVRVHTVRELPPDWLGKTHALAVGAAGVATRWILFTDTDARLSDDTIARAIAAAERADAQHVCVLPNHRHATFWGKVVLLAFQLTAQRRVFAVNRDRAGAFVGVGAFNLVRTDAYRAIGGHAPLRLEVVDDVWLGFLLRRAGHRTRVWFAGDDFTIDWGATPLQFVRVVAKNMFAVLRFRTSLAVLAAALATVLIGGAFAAPLLGAFGWFPFAGCILGGLAGVALAARLHWPPLAGALVQLGRLWLVIALLNSTLTTLRQGGVRWRGTFYPLAQLRRGQVPMR